MDSLVKLHSTGLEITPDTGQFGLSSSISFILQLCTLASDSTSDSVVCNIDTLYCFRNLNGYLRFQNYPCSFNIRSNIPLKGVIPSNSYYFRVQRADSLPATSHYLGYDYVECTEQHSGGSGTSLGYYFTQYQVGYPPVSMKALLARYDSISNIVKLEVYPNPATRLVTLHVETPVKAIGATVDLIDEAGRSVYHQSVDLPRGASEWRLSLPAIHSGSYTLVARARQWGRTVKCVFAK